ncbi:class I SAM-dependent methyltransferase [Natrinema soli]|uniref:Class I SAM-dependent methyltransferase n=1 Tax=Natrinema soli TaxID=1930624 RepID=A0ABD5SVF9_9EURY|nr:methyltransferase domain-containing protein [Natrinema soli]
MTRPDQNGGAVKELVRQHWNGRAMTFDDASQHGTHSEEQHEQWLSVLREWTGDEPLAVLDIGCGTGVISLLLAELDHDVTGVDFAPEMLERAREKAERTSRSADFYRGDAEALAVPDDALELVTARHLLWTLPNPETALEEWRRVVEPGGRILVIEGYWNHAEPWDEYEAIHDDLPMYDGRPPEELRAVFERHGLREIEHEPLVDPVLWGREPRHEYYILAGTVSK